MKRLKITSVLLSAAMCMSLIATPVCVLADETTAPSYAQSTEAAESKEPEATKEKVKETEKKTKETKSSSVEESKSSEGKETSAAETKAPEVTKEKETTPSDTEETNPSKEKETTASETSVVETSKATESSERDDNEPEESKTSDPTESGSKETDKTKISETTASNEKTPTESSVNEEPTESSNETTVTEERIPSQSANTPKKNADSKTCGDNLTWYFTGRKLIISGSGDMYNYSSEYSAPWYDFKSEIEEVELPESITSIGNYAFYKCESLTYISLYSDITSIGNYAFYGCESLTGLTFFTGVTSIGNYAFYGCSNMTSISIPDSVTSIGEDAFDKCGNIKYVHYYGTKDDFDKLKIDINNDSFTNANFYFKNVAFGRCGDNLKWTYEGGTLTISGSGDMYDFTYFSRLWTFDMGIRDLKHVVLPENITSIGDYAFADFNIAQITIPNSVTSIGEWSFYYCSTLTNITIPNSVTSIGNHAFYGCYNLSSITISNRVSSISKETFYGCSRLSSISIPDSVTSIGEDAFYDCSWLSEIELPVSVTSIADGAFGKCENLDYVYYSGTKADLDKVVIGNDNDALTEANYHCKDISFGKCGDNVNWTFEGTTLTVSGSGEMSDYWIEGSGAPWETFRRNISSLVFSGDVTSIGNHAFYECKQLTSVTIPNSVKKIGYYAFEECTNLTNVNIPNSITLINSGVFSGCERLKNITIPDSVTSIDEYAFEGCIGLTSIVIPNSVTSIGASAFHGCMSLTSITIPDGVTEIASESFYCCSSLTSITIPKSVTLIGEDAFGMCSSLTSITIPDSVTSIGNFAFSYCTNLSSIEIPNSVISIGYYAFSNCKKLTSINIPSSVTSIGSDAFEDCIGLKSVTISDGVASIGTYAFYGCTGLTSITLPGSIVKLGDSAFHKTSLNTVTYKGTKAEWENITVQFYDDDDEIVEKFMKDAFSDVFPKVTVLFDICEKIGHDITHCDAKSPTETSTGCDEHYECKNCGKVFLDSEGKNETTLEAVTLCLITVSNVSNGTLSADKTIAHVGEEITLTVNPDAGYEVTAIKVNGSSITGTKFTVPAENVKIEVVFSKIKIDNTLKVTGKTAKVKFKKLRKKKQTVSRAKMMTVSGAQGSLTYKIVSVNKKKSSFKINASTGAVTVKKKLKKGTYTLKVSVTAAGNENYKPATKTVSFKIKVK